MKQQHRIHGRHRRWLTGMLLSLSMLIVTACSLGKQEVSFGHEAEITQRGYLVCGQECKDRGQCGQLGDGTIVVLVNTTGPATQNQDSFLGANTAVAIEGVVQETVVQVNDGQEMTLPFYQVRAEGQNVPAWSAGWCVASNLP